MTPERLDAAIVYARQWPGLGAHGRAPVFYADLLFPNDRKAWRLDASHSMSSCALTGLAFYRALGVKDPRLSRPYEGRYDAVSLVVSVATDAGAWVHPGPSAEPPAPGSVILIGRNGDVSWGRPCFEHVAIVTAYDAATGAVICTEGGQGAGGTSIAESRRLLIWRGEALWAVRADTPTREDGSPFGRRVFGYSLANLF